MFKKERISSTLGIEILIIGLLIAIITSIFISQNLGEFIFGYYKIITNASRYITDTTVVGNMGGALLNGLSMLLLMYFIIKKNKIAFTGVTYSQLFIIFGYSFLGTNLINFAPFLLGVYLYSRFQKVPFKQLTLVAVSASGMSPIVSFFLFETGFGTPTAIITGLFIGVFLGFIFSNVTQKTFVWHNGYTLFTTSMTSGLIGFVFFGLFKTYGIDVSLEPYVLGSKENHIFFLAFLIIFGIFNFVFGLYNNGWSFKNYNRLLKTSGRFITNFATMFGSGITMINVGIMTFFYIIMLLIIGQEISAPLFGATIVAIGFSSFGVHPRNALPLFLGIMLLVLFSGNQFINEKYIISMLFAVALAPVAGDFGYLAGMIAGILHMATVISMTEATGGIILYTNGVSTIFVAALIVPIFELFREKEGD